MTICIRRSCVFVTATIQANFPQGRALLEASAQILWFLYSSQVCGKSRISVSSAQLVEDTS
jgi:hypothetical protein